MEKYFTGVLFVLQDTDKKEEVKEVKEVKEKKKKTKRGKAKADEVLFNSGLEDSPDTQVGEDGGEGGEGVKGEN